MAIYFFVDGAYFREAYESTMRSFYGVVPEINFNNFGNHFAHANRYYYYDSIDRSRVKDETQEQADERIAALDTFHAYLNSLESWHVREGFVSRGRRASRRQQKAVDVQLAVDALEHAVAKNMDSAYFILGDLDFEPLFFSLNRFGVKTIVFYEQGTASPELLEAADTRYQITITTCFQLATHDFRHNHKHPTITSVAQPCEDPVIRRWRWKKRLATMHFRPGNSTFTICIAPGANPSRNPCLLVSWPEDNEAKVQQAFIMTHGGEIEWET